MKRLARSFLIGSMTLSMALTAGLASATHTAESGPGAEPTAEAKPGKAHGMMRMVAEVLGQLDLSPEQHAKLEGLRDLVTDQGASREAKRAFASALVDQVEAGKVDRAALQDRVDDFVRYSAAREFLRVKAFEALHRVLTPEQRKLFVDKLEQRLDQMASEHPAGQWLGKWSQALGLSDAQRQQLQPLVAAEASAHAEHRATFRRVLEAFKGDDFSFEKVVPDYDATAHAKGIADAIVSTAETVTRVLTPTQRATAARAAREKIAQKAEGQAQRGGDEAGENTGSTQSRIVWGVPTYGAWGAPGVSTWGWSGGLAPYTGVYGWGWPGTGLRSIAPYATSYGLYW